MPSFRGTDLNEETVRVSRGGNWGECVVLCNYSTGHAWALVRVCSCKTVLYVDDSACQSVRSVNSDRQNMHSASLQIKA